jgi:DNA-binding XRE family transcriptional regulator
MADHEPVTEGTRAPEGTPRAVFGRMIRFYRMKAVLTQDQLGALVHLAGKTIASYEKAHRVPPFDIAELMDALPALRTNDALAELWRLFEDGMRYQNYPGGFPDWWERVAQAKRLRWYGISLIPGLLQTEDYARAVFRTRIGVTEEVVEGDVADRLRLQEILLRDEPPMLWVILEEGVLHRPTGGPRVMFNQVKRLIEATSQPNIVIEVIRSTVGSHTGLNGAGFLLANFVDQPSSGYQDGTIRGHQIMDPKDVEELEMTWDMVRHEAEPRASSLALLEEAAKSWTSAMNSGASAA